MFILYINIFFKRNNTNAKINKSNNKNIVWKYYITENKISSRCKLCTKVLKHSGNTTNLMQHLQRKHTLHLHPNNFTKNIDKENIDKTNACTDEQPSNSNIMTNKDNSENDIDVDDPDVSNCSYNVNSCILKHKVNYKINIYTYII